MTKMLSMSLKTRHLKQEMIFIKGVTMLDSWRASRPNLRKSRSICLILLRVMFSPTSRTSKSVLEIWATMNPLDFHPCLESGTWHNFRPSIEKGYKKKFKANRVSNRRIFRNCNSLWNKRLILRLIRQTQKKSKSSAKRSWNEMSSNRSVSKLSRSMLKPKIKSRYSSCSFWKGWVTTSFICSRIRNLSRCPQ